MSILSKKKYFRDRPDGTFVKTVDSIHIVMAHLLPKRTEAEVYSLEKIDVTRLLRFIDEKNAGNKEYTTTLFHAVITAMFKTIYNRPLMNRFIAGKRYYDRNDISISFVIKNAFTDTAEERILIIRAENTMTFSSVSKKIYDEVHEVRSSNSNPTNEIIEKVVRLPKPVFSLFAWAYLHLDKHGWIPESLWKNDQNFTTVLVSNLGSIGAGACHHHLNNYGTNSIMITIGEIKKEYVMDKTGTVHEKDYVEIGITVDERIADGFYFAKSFDQMKYFLTHPHLLEEPVSTPFIQWEKTPVAEPSGQKIKESLSVKDAAHLYSLPIKNR